MLKNSDNELLTRTGPRTRRRAHTGPPASARTALTPIARRRVLLPLMFEPVITSAVPAPFSATSFATRLPGAIRG